MTTLGSKKITSVAFAALLATATALGTVSPSWADPGHGSVDFGQPGSAAEVDRTIEVLLGDNYFEPSQISVQEGETIRFVLSNEGELLHEFNIGTAAMHAAHQEEMMTMMEHGMLTPVGIDHDMMNMDHGSMGQSMGMMVHDDPNSVLVEPGAVEELIWTFASATELEFACNVPGHYQAGMFGPVHFDR